MSRTTTQRRCHKTPSGTHKVEKCIELHGLCLTSGAVLSFPSPYPRAAFVCVSCLCGVCVRVCVCGVITARAGLTGVRHITLLQQHHHDTYHHPTPRHTPPTPCSPQTYHTLTVAATQRQCAASHEKDTVRVLCLCRAACARSTSRCSLALHVVFHLKIEPRGADSCDDDVWVHTELVFILPSPAVSDRLAPTSHCQ